MAGACRGKGGGRRNKKMSSLRKRGGEISWPVKHGEVNEVGGGML